MRYISSRIENTVYFKQLDMLGHSPALQIFRYTQELKIQYISQSIEIRHPVFDHLNILSGILNVGHGISTTRIPNSCCFSALLRKKYSWRYLGNKSTKFETSCSKQASLRRVAGNPKGGKGEIKRPKLDRIFHKILQFTLYFFPQLIIQESPIPKIE